MGRVHGRFDDERAVGGVLPGGRVTVMITATNSPAVTATGEASGHNSP